MIGRLRESAEDLYITPGIKSCIRNDLLKQFGRHQSRTGKREQRHIGMCAARGGDVVGEHQMMFLGQGEQLILTHRATTREHFCLGALQAVRFVHNRKSGLFSAEDVFGANKG